MGSRFVTFMDFCGVAGLQSSGRAGYECRGCRPCVTEGTKLATENINNSGLKNSKVYFSFMQNKPQGRLFRVSMNSHRYLGLLSHCSVILTWASSWSKVAARAKLS